MAISAEHTSKFAALHRQWWRLQMSEKFSSGMKNSRQTNQHRIGEVPNAYTQLFEDYLVLSLQFAIKTLSTYLSLCLCWHDHSARHVVLSVYVSKHQWLLLKYSTMYRLLYTERPTFPFISPACS